MAEVDARVADDATTTSQPPEAPAAEQDPAHDAGLDPDSIAQPGQVQAQAAFDPNATIAAATTDATTTEPVAGVPPGDTATMAATASTQDQSEMEADGGRHQEVQAPAQGDTAATAQETVSAQAQIQAHTITPIDDTAPKRQSGAFTSGSTLPTVSETDTRPTSDPAAAIPPPEPATDAAPPPPLSAEPPALAALPDDLPAPRFVAPSSYLRPKTSQRTGNPPPAAMVTQEQHPPPLGPYDKEQLQGLVSLYPSILCRVWSCDVCSCLPQGPRHALPT